MRILEGDALLRMADLPAAGIDACVTDPPYGLKFMGRTWDHGVPGKPYWSEVLRVLKPGGWLVAFGGTRTYHRLTCAIEDAGFDIRDCLMWLYGSGFPKGKGCLKPGWEPIVLARKPGPRPTLQIDACRVEAVTGDYAHHGNDLGRRDDEASWRFQKRKVEPHSAGRWPTNVVLSHEDGCREIGTVEIPSHGGSVRTDSLGRMNDDAWQPKAHQIIRPSSTVGAWECVSECAVRLLDADAGVSRSSGLYRATDHGANGNQRVTDFGGRGVPATMYADHGGPSRYFYCAKASPSERGAFNDHPTVKPLALMRWLVRLVTPQGGTVLDPFCGSGSTLLAAAREGFDAIGIDADPHAVEIATRRLREDAGPLLADLEVTA
jgi:DNA modification methylase